MIKQRFCNTMTAFIIKQFLYFYFSTILAYVIIIIIIIIRGVLLPALRHLGEIRRADMVLQLTRMLSNVSCFVTSYNSNSAAATNRFTQLNCLFNE